MARWGCVYGKNVGACEDVIWECKQVRVTKWSNEEAFREYILRNSGVCVVIGEDGFVFPYACNYGV